MQINVFGRTTRNGIEQGKNTEENLYGRNGQPTNPEGKRLLKDKYNYLLKMSDSQLLNVLWGATFGLGSLDSILLRSGDLKKILESHYKGRSGKELYVNMPDSYWSNSFSNDRDGLLREIKYAVQRELESKRWSQFQNYSIDCSSILDKADINFRADFINPSLLAPMGGVQEVVLRTIKVEEKEHRRPMRPTLMDFSTGNHKDYVITLEIKIRDRFAVDTDDFAFSNWRSNKGKALATALGREALVAFWILQHQRGYPPFVWNAIFKSTINVHQPTKR
jgi:hypothetical protein